MASHIISHDIAVSHDATSQHHNSSSLMQFAPVLDG